MTRAMILAAGRGERMRPLSDTTPKALLEVAGRPLIEWQLVRLVAAGFAEVVINHAWLGDAIEQRLGDGARFGATIRYSAEGTALETAGGIARALPLLGSEPFVVVSADIFTDFDYRRLDPVIALIAHAGPSYSAHLVLTDNPPYHSAGDMALVDGQIRLDGPRLTYANIAVFHPRLFAALAPDQKLALFPWFYRWLGQTRVSGEHLRGVWQNIGTPEQLLHLNAHVGSVGAGIAPPA